MTKRKKCVALLASMVLAASTSITSFAWDTEQYLYEPTVDENGYVTGWNWEDTDCDGTFECYYRNMDFYNSCDDEFKRVLHKWTALTDVNQYIRTTPDGYQVNAKMQWVVDGVVQTKTREKDTSADDSVLADIPYDPAHPLACVMDRWNLRLTPETNFLNYNYIAENDNIHAMLTGQMEYYHPRTGGGADRLNEIELEVYQWFCNWLNGMDFQNMSEMERARAIKDVLAMGNYDNSYDSNTNIKNVIYTTMIEKKGVCADFAMTVRSLAKCLGLKSALGVNPSANHATCFVQVDGKPYLSSNLLLQLDYPADSYEFSPGYNSSIVFID
ncbi:hypothetical protein [Lacrimispora sp. 210928-DFI.3.58]|uniref:hypothetical protein n=1 Tax=Lacrimispora sp. 210928-DFI.3.58 TaxID=2883214 RepID=UPI0015B4157F|nr:hypothetical protein [Lacrimispora sp. 210928-DFI.3.58]MCB7318647.1 hypothetical protein [Lacrimispora sp. 210928-DFI.3.58]